MSKWTSMNQTCFVYDYFVHMWFAPWARKFEPNEYKQLATWLKKKKSNFSSLQPFGSKFQGNDLFFIKFTQWTCTCIGVQFCKHVPKWSKPLFNFVYLTLKKKLEFF